MKRPLFIATLGAALSLSTVSAFAENTTPLKPILQAKCLPGQPCWPTDQQWAAFAKTLTKPTDLVIPTNPLTTKDVDDALAACKNSRYFPIIHGTICYATLNYHVKNPYYLESLPGGTTNQGMFETWSPHFNTYGRAVAVETPQDIQKAVDFARAHNLRVIIRGRGHDAWGRSSADTPAEANSLTIWTHKMQGVTYHPQFTPVGAASTVKPLTAVTVKAGNTWASVYQTLVKEPIPQRVVGGTGFTVGACGGYSLGGGVSQYVTRQYGTTAANLLQAQVVTADGQLLTVNKYQHPDLFWALRGGGPGFGVVTQMTYRTYPLSQYLVNIGGSLTVKNNNEAAFKTLIKTLLTTTNNSLLGGHWGGAYSINGNGSIRFDVQTNNLTPDAMKTIWDNSAIAKLVAAHPELYTSSLSFSHRLAVNNWSPAGRILFLDIIPNLLPGYPKNEYWQKGDSWDSHEDGAYGVDYTSWWLPVNLFQKDKIDQTVDTLYSVAKLKGRFTIVLGKTTGGGPKLARQLTAETAMNPGINKAEFFYNNGNFAWQDAQGAKSLLFPSVIPLTGAQKVEIKHVRAIDYQALQQIQALAPNAGTYINEADYNDKNWQKDYWGLNNYCHRHKGGLYGVKYRYDPTGLFYAHHGVGSELWNEGGMTPNPNPVNICANQ